MRKGFLAVMLLVGPSSQAWPAPRRAPRDETLVPRKESWHTLKMEATAIMGELKYQHGDLSGAAETFRDSLNSSTKLLTPQDQVMGLDLYRTAELAARGGRFAQAREHLEILIHRFPDSEWAEKGRRLLDLLPRSHAGLPDNEAPITPVVTKETPEFALGRVQASLREGADRDALDGCSEFLDLYPDHPAAKEIELLAGALHLRLGQARPAARLLKGVARAARGSELGNKAAYLLGAALLELDDHSALRAALHEARRPASPGPGNKPGPWPSLAQVWLAASEARQGRSQAALARYRRVLDAGIESPLMSYALAALAAEWDRQGRTREAMKTLSRARIEASRWAQQDLESAAGLSLAHLQYKARRLQAAADAYSDFLGRHPGHPQTTLALYQQGLALKRLGRAQRAAASFLRLVEEHPGSVYASDAHLQLGQLYTQLGSSQKAVEHYRRMGGAGTHEGRRESLLLIAQVHYNRKRYAEAIPLYWRFLEQNPADPRRREVESLLLASYWLGAREDPGLLKAIALYPRHPIVAHIRWELASRALREGDAQRALELFSRYAADYPASPRAPDALYFQAESWQKLGGLPQAQEAYRRLIARFPKHALAAQARWRLAAALAEAGDHQASAAMYQNLSAGRGAQAAEALYRRALALSRAGRKATTLAACEQLMTRFPRHAKAAWAWSQIGRLREEAGRTGAAIKAYAKLRGLRPAQDPARVGGLLRLGLLYELGSRPLKALPLYAEVMRLSPKESRLFEAARARVQALTLDGSLVRR